MRTIQEYAELVESKYEEDHEWTGISIPECVDFVIDNAFFMDEILYQSVDPLKDKVLQLIKNKEKVA